MAYGSWLKRSFVEKNSQLIARNSLPKISVHLSHQCHQRAIKNERRFLRKVKAIHCHMKGDSSAK